MDNKNAELHDLVVTRVFAAPVDRVWEAWTDSDMVMQWWGPDRFTSPSAVIDFREGGTSVVCMRAPPEFGGQDSYSAWTYTSIVPLRRIELIHNLSDPQGNKLDPVSVGMPADFPQDQRHTVDFRDLGGGKTELTVTEYGWPPGQMLTFSKMGMEQCLNKMAAALDRKRQS